MGRSKEIFNIKVEIEDPANLGEYIRCEATVEALIVTQQCGADADGGRGVMRTTVDEITILGMLDNEGRLINPDTLSEGVIEKIQRIVEERI